MRLEYDLNVGALYIRLSDLRVRPAHAKRAATPMSTWTRTAGLLVSRSSPSPLRWPVEDILTGYDIDPAERRQIEAYYGLVRPAAPRQLLEVPTLEAEPTAAVTVAVPVAA